MPWFLKRKATCHFALMSRCGKSIWIKASQHAGEVAASYNPRPMLQPYLYPRTSRHCPGTWSEASPSLTKSDDIILMPTVEAQATLPKYDWDPEALWLMSHPYFPVPADICRAKEINQVASQIHQVEVWKDPVLNPRGVTMQKSLTLASTQQARLFLWRKLGWVTEPPFFKSPAYVWCATWDPKNLSLRTKRSKYLNFIHCFLAHTLTLPLCRFPAGSAAPSSEQFPASASCPREPSPSATVTPDFLVSMPDLRVCLCYVLGFTV